MFQVVGASIVQKEITGLRPYTRYYIQVAGLDDQGVQGELSELVNVTTPEAGRSMFACDHDCIKCLIIIISLKPPPLRINITMKPLYCRHPWDSQKCPD